MVAVVVADRYGRQRRGAETVAETVAGAETETGIPVVATGPTQIEEMRRRAETEAETEAKMTVTSGRDKRSDRDSR
jgi:hypothetical protein